MNTACWLWQQGVSFAWLALARDQLPQGNWTLSVWNRETFISTFTFLKICWNMLKYTQRMTKKSLEAKLSKESIHMLRCKIPDQYRSLRNVWDYMGLHGISDVPGMQLLCLASYQHNLTHPLSISNDTNVESESVQGINRKKYIS